MTATSCTCISQGASVLSALNASNRGFRANDVITGAAKTNPVEENGTFSVTRKAQIEQIVESSAVKRFARSKVCIVLDV